ncbi:YjbQ family protein [Sporolactobacillus putidus]|uniref:Secondary thiamine-phosphate synthase enzyme n=1 Tax=Sporolactobacillus putidus TaxID=492735 RepID=A0A917S4S8_9BACL|nr:YjbQ family protein [Sporolactobacillus putidus]GGL57088.1 secondary thiamine-phosphate synthase enzyme [Sporolactobacillus putidus]
MIIHNDKLVLTSNGNRPSYHEITDEVRRIVKESHVKNGIVVVSTPHTTCSVFFEEYSHDRNYNGDEYLQVDLDNVLEAIVPTTKSDRQYYHPGPEHTKFAEDISKTDTATEGTIMVPNRHSLLNTDAHIRGSLLGSSETFIIQNGIIQIGKVGYVYFVDWDHTRSRNRQCLVEVLGE